ncbi:MAG: histidine kinase [Tannerellaceae bacterium]|jgi:signal transduction histidine kinase|nr:histidine kinase [Tannerellaceae bacterium]
MNPFRKKKDVRPDLGVLLSEFNRSLMLIVDKPLLIANFTSRIKQLFPVESVCVFLLDESAGKYKLQNPDGGRPDIVLTPKDRLVNWLSVNDKYLAVSQRPDILTYFSEEEQAILGELKTELIYPLKVMNRINGTVLVSRKTDGVPFTGQELALFSLLLDQAAFAIEHASLYEIQTERVKRMYRADRLATLGELAAGAAHEIRNPLTAIRSTIQYLGRDLAGDSVRQEMVAELIAETERINRIVQGLLSFARPSELHIAETDAEQLIGQALLLLNATLGKNRIDVQFEYFTRDTRIQGDGEQLKQVFVNILLNAIEAMAKNEPQQERTLIISIETGAPVNLYSRYLLISFEDTGEGIGREEIENVFDPFFTTKEEGTGLGLAICYGIVSRHEGEIEVKSVPGKGTSFTVKLPQQYTQNKPPHESKNINSR